MEIALYATPKIVRINRAAKPLSGQRFIIHFQDRQNLRLFYLFDSNYTSLMSIYVVHNWDSLVMHTLHDNVRHRQDRADGYKLIQRGSPSLPCLLTSKTNLTTQRARK